VIIIIVIIMFIRRETIQKAAIQNCGQNKYYYKTQLESVSVSCKSHRKYQHFIRKFNAQTRAITFMSFTGLS